MIVIKHNLYGLLGKLRFNIMFALLKELKKAKPVGIAFYVVVIQCNILL